jgi:hypothetical protein
MPQNLIIKYTVQSIKKEGWNNGAIINLKEQKIGDISLIVKGRNSLAFVGERYKKKKEKPNSQ